MMSKPSPLNPFKTNDSIRSKRHNNSSRRKESKHYQESDILESPSVYMEYCRSNLGDKISDYEDLWTQENNSRSSLHIPVVEQSNIISVSAPKECDFALSSPHQLTPSSATSATLIGREIAITTKCTTPLQPKIAFFEKKSGFYSDPVDAVVVAPPTFPHVVRREPKLNPLPSFHRYSEPPKGQFEDMNFNNIHEKGNNNNMMQHGQQQQAFIAASLDHLKSINKPINTHRLDPTWAVDSSWEFVDKNDDSSESSSVRNLKQMTSQNSLRHPNSTLNNNKNKSNNNHYNNQQHKIGTNERNHCAMSVDSYLMNSKKSNIYKMVAKKYPDIVLRGSTSISTQSNIIPSTWQTFDSDNGSNKFQRLSSYDNVIEVQSIYAGSEDGTLFSEPWDSSQWDSFFPNTDGK